MYPKHPRRFKRHTAVYLVHAVKQFQGTPDNTSSLHKHYSCPDVITRLSLTGVYIVRRLERDDGAEPRMVQERTRGVALREHGYHEARVYDPRSEPRSSEEDPLQERRRANHPVGERHTRGQDVRVLACRYSVHTSCIYRHHLFIR